MPNVTEIKVTFLWTYETHFIKWTQKSPPKNYIQCCQVNLCTCNTESILQLQYLQYRYNIRDNLSVNTKNNPRSSF